VYSDSLQNVEEEPEEAEKELPAENDWMQHESPVVKANKKYGKPNQIG